MTEHTQKILDNAIAVFKQCNRNITEEFNTAIKQTIVTSETVDLSEIFDKYVAMINDVVPDPLDKAVYDTILQSETQSKQEWLLMYLYDLFVTNLECIMIKYNKLSEIIDTEESSDTAKASARYFFVTLITCNSTFSIFIETELNEL